MSNQQPVLFITGATGFLGGATVAHLLASDLRCRIVALVRGEDAGDCELRLKRSLARFDMKYCQSLPSNLEILQGDLMHTEWRNDPKLADLTHVLHVAANTSFGRSSHIRKTNIEGALAVANAVRDHKLVRYIHVGTAHISGVGAPPVVTEDMYPSETAEHLVPYTQSKAEAEMLLMAEANHLPLVIARPSIIVGHTKLGCGPSGSIFWVSRAVDKLGLITWDPENKMDVIAVDYAAAALSHLLMAPTLKYDRYHISAGPERSITWNEGASDFARVMGGPADRRYRQVPFEQITREVVAEALGERHARHMMKALELYYQFCGVNVVFDNQRLVSEGFPAPEKPGQYLQTCIDTSPEDIYEQMLSDF